MSKTKNNWKAEKVLDRRLNREKHLSIIRKGMNKAGLIKLLGSIRNKHDF